MVMQAICRTASPMNSFVGLYNSTCEGSFSVCLLLSWITQKKLAAELKETTIALTTKS